MEVSCSSDKKKPSCSLYPGQKNCATYIFLIDIKLALGNNPHHFLPFSWNVHVAYIIRVQYFVAQQ